MENITLEVCCGSVDDVFEAAAAGAHRVELNAGMFLGGLTPSIGAVRAAREAGIPVMAMVRPREGGFCYTEREFAGMVNDVEAFVEAGVEGVVFGVLNADGTVDARRCRTLLEAAQGRETVFHRAMDVVPDWAAALDTLMELGFTRVLTSGQASSALLGAEVIRGMRERSAGRIQILPGGGIRPANVEELAARTGCTQFHASFGARRSDPSCLGNPEIHFGGALYPPEDLYTVTDRARVAEMLARLGK